MFKIYILHELVKITIQLQQGLLAMVKDESYNQGQGTLPHNFDKENNRAGTRCNLHL